jgi:hypothetical protein
MTVMTDTDVIDLLQAQTFFPNRDRHPKCPLVIFKAITRDPGRPPWELDIIQDNKNVTMVHPGKETGKRREIWPAGGNDHGVTTCPEYELLLCFYEHLKNEH